METRRPSPRRLEVSPWRQGLSAEGGRPRWGWLALASASWVLCRTCCAASDLPVQTTTATGADVIQVDSERKGAEEEVLGPLRIWHIVFIVVTLVIIAVTIVCCCVEIRIPRSRLEIEETYRIRKMNQQYLHQLERTPDALLRQGKASSAAAAGSVSVEQSALPRRGGKGQDLYHVHPAASNSRQQPIQRQQQQQQHQHQRPHQRHHHHRSRDTGDDEDDYGDVDEYGENEEHVSVAVTDSSARLAKLRKSQMYGVQTPFALTGIASLQKEKRPGGSGRGGRGG